MSTKAKEKLTCSICYDNARQGEVYWRTYGYPFPPIICGPCFGLENMGDTDGDCYYSKNDKPWKKRK